MSGSIGKVASHTSAARRQLAQADGAIDKLDEYARRLKEIGKAHAGKDES